MDARANDGSRMDNIYFAGNAVCAILIPICAAIIWYFDSWHLASFFVTLGILNVLLAVWYWRRRLHPDRQ